MKAEPTGGRAYRAPKVVHFLTLLLTALALSCGLRTAQAQQVLFRDDFNSLNQNVWDVHKTSSNGSYNIHDTTFDKDPTIVTQSGSTFMRLALDTYNPNSPGSRYLGTEVWSNRANQFAMGPGVEFEARIRGSNLFRNGDPTTNAIQRGICYAFFTYRNRDGSGVIQDFNNDKEQEEIDFEFLSNFLDDARRATPSNANSNLWLNVFNSEPAYSGIPRSSTTQTAVAGLDQTQWHTYTARWTNDAVRWYVDGNLVRTETGVVPDEQMSLCFNIWGPNSGWGNAYDSSLTKSSTSGNNKRYYFDVDYVEVRSVPPAANSGVIGTGGGLAAAFFDNANFTNQKTQLDRVVQRINYNWAGGSINTSQIAPDTFSAIFSGQIQPQFSGNHTFYINTTDGVRLTINGQVVINQLNAQTTNPTEYTGTINLTAGQLYPITLEYVEQTGNAVVSLKWSTTGLSKQLVATTQLYPPQVATPVFNPPGGNYGTPQSVQVTCSTAGADIHYTLDGDEPVRTDPTIASGGTINVGSSLTLKAKAWKDGIWASNTATATYTISNDTTAPTATISVPGGNGWSFRSLTQASGTASDTGGSGLAGVTVLLYAYANNSYWNGSAWATTATELPATGTDNWTFNMPTLPDGRYAIRATGRDGNGNTGSSSVIDFYIDNVGPTVTIASPVVGTFTALATTNGTAVDTGPGVAQVVLQLFRYADSNYWNGSAWTGSAATFNASGTDNWSQNLPALADGRYRLAAAASDYVNNTGTPATVDFTIDSSAPGVSITTPANGAVLTALGGLGGSASDGTSGVARVEVVLQRNSNGQFWNGSAWSATQAILTATISGTSWSVGNVPSGDLLTNGTYAVRATAFDANSNNSTATSTFTVQKTTPNPTPTTQPTATPRPTATPLPGVTPQPTATPLPTSTPLPGVTPQPTATPIPTVAPQPDRTAPVINFTSHRTRSAVSRFGNIGGITTDNVGVVRTDLVIQRVSDRRYWNGSGWTAAATRLSTQDRGSVWYRNTGLPAGNQLEEGVYILSAVAYDVASNRGAASVVVTIDLSGPRTYFTTPLNGTVVSNLSRVNGRAEDAGSGTRRVDLVIYRKSDRLYWTGDSWTPTPVRVATVVAANNWTRVNGMPSGVTLPDGAYELTAVSYDGLGNRGDARAAIIVRKPRTDGEADVTAAPSANRLSLGAARSADGVVALLFTAPLAATAADPAHYVVTVNGVPVAVEGASYNAALRRIDLLLPAGAFRSGDVIYVAWNDLTDSKGLTMTGQWNGTAR